MDTFPAFSVNGIELEHMIVDSTTLSVLPIADRLLSLLSATDIPEKSAITDWSHELVKHVVELKNPQPTADLKALHHAFQSEIERANKVLNPLNARLMPGGVHPWMDPLSETSIWDHGNSDIYQTYHRIFNCHRHGWANLQSMHLNLPFANSDEFARLHAAIRIVLPILPALTASSPIIDQRNSRFMDYRMEAYRNNSELIPSITGDIIPEIIFTSEEYQQRILDPMYRDIGPYDTKNVLRHEWLNSRGAIARFERNAIEIRIMDTQECTSANLALAALTIGLIKILYKNKTSSLQDQQNFPSEELIKIFLGCNKDADYAFIDNTRYLELFAFPNRQCTAKELWWYLLEIAFTQSIFNSSVLVTERSGTGYSLFSSNEKHTEWKHWKETLLVILKQGPLARRIMHAVNNDYSRENLQLVYSDLCRCLNEDKLFLV